MKFEELIAPLDKDIFYNTVVDKKPFVIRGNEHKKKFFSEIISWEGISDYLNNDRAVSGFQMIAPGDIKLCMEKKGLTPENHYSWGRAPQWDKAKAHKLWNEGHSMILTKASQLSPNMNAIAGAVEEGFPNGAADAHFYCSPNKNAATFPCHADRDDNYLVHAIGTVHWQVWNVRMKREKDGGRWTYIGRSTISVEEESKLGTPVIDIYLGPGDLLYIPAGYFHKATPVGARVSISVPLMQSDRGEVPLNRKYYDFGKNIS
jgi:ribosomal protein L16 Arg81 hydroxylase